MNIHSRKTTMAGILFTVCLHLCLIVLLLFYHSPLLEKGSKDKNNALHALANVKLILLPIKRQISTPSEINKGRDYGYIADTTVCSNKGNYYRGIGIIYGFGTQIIIYAPPYYPAYQAGIRPGDIILDDDLEIIDGYMDLTVIRDGIKLKFHVKADLICSNI